jgi:hypothetical protein
VVSLLGVVPYRRAIFPLLRRRGALSPKLPLLILGAADLDSCSPGIKAGPPPHREGLLLANLETLGGAKLGCQGSRTRADSSAFIPGEALVRGSQ